MATIDIGQFAFFALVITLAFAVRGAAGFGSAAVAVPLAALTLPIQLVIPVVAGLQLLSTAEFSLRKWRQVLWSEMLRIAPFLLLGVLMGLYLFYQLDARVIAKGLGVFVILYALYTMATAGRTERPPRKLPWPVAIALNAGGAFVGALFGGASSPFYVMYLRALRITGDAFRATMTMVILIQVVLRIGGYAGMGFFDATALLIGCVAVPFMFLGGKLGDVIAERVSVKAFNRIVGAVLLVSGAALTLK